MRREIVIGLIALTALVSRPAAAIEFADQRVEIHGYYEAQIRSIVRDFEFSDDWDLTQWWNVLALEIEWAVAPDGFGPFDTIDVFGRVEVRYDRVWTGGCSFFDSANTYGYNAQRLPKRLSDARRAGWAGTHYTGDERHYYDIPFSEISDTPNRDRLRPSGSRLPLQAPFAILSSCRFTNFTVEPASATAKCWCARAIWRARLARTAVP